MRVGCQPGSFNPPTRAHLALAAAAREQAQLDRVVWVLSRVALAKEHVVRPTVDERARLLEQITRPLRWLEVEVTDAQLLVEVAAGYEVLIIGADKWHQIRQPHWYGGEAERDAAMAALPELLVAPRDGLDVPAEIELRVPPEIAEVSSTRARAGERHLMLAEAAELDARSGIWTSRDGSGPPHG